MSTSSGTSRAGAVRYLALGDSYTIGTGGPPERAFPARLAERWRARGIRAEIRNPAVNGYTTDDLIRDELPLVSSFRPTFVTLLIGSNDIVRGRDAATYRQQLRTITRRAGVLGVDLARLLVISAPDWSWAPEGARYGDPVTVARLVDEYASVAREEARRNGARFFDIVPLSRRQADEGKFAPDRLHFSAEAYAEWAAAIDATLREWELP